MYLFPFLPNWSNPVNVGSEFLTRVLASPTGAEQRFALRISPRRDYEYSILLYDRLRPFAEDLIRSIGSSEMCIPIWTDAEMIYSNLALSTTIFVEDIEYSEYKVGDFIAIIDVINQIESDFVKIESIVDNKVILERSPAGNFGQWVYIAPAKKAYFNPDNKFEVELVRVSDAVYTASIKFFNYEPDDDTPDDANSPDNSFLIYDGLAVNQYAAKDGKLPSKLGTSEGQFSLISGLAAASMSLRNYDASSSGYYKKLYTKMYNSIGFGNIDGAIIRQHYPKSENDIVLLNDLFLAGEDIKSNRIYFEQDISVSPDGSLRIPPNIGGDLVTDIYMIYPSDSRLGTLATDATTSSFNQTKITTKDWIKNNGYAIISVPQFNDAGAFNASSSYKVVYRCKDPNDIPHGSGLQVFPTWNPLPFRYCILSAGIYKFFDLATNYIMNDDNLSFDKNMLILFLLASRNTLAKNLDTRPLKHFLKKNKQIQPIHSFDEFNGTYCFSGRSGEVASQGVDGNPACLGFNRWFRDQQGMSLASIDDGVFGIGVSGFFDIKSGELSCEVFISRPLADGEDYKVFLSRVNGYNKVTFLTASLKKYNLTPNQTNYIKIPLSDFSVDDAPCDNWDPASDCWSNINILSSRNKTINSGIDLPYPKNGNEWLSASTPKQEYDMDLVW